jgi:hypothetical protein
MDVNQLMAELSEARTQLDHAVLALEPVIPPLTIKDDEAGDHDESR